VDTLRPGPLAEYRHARRPTFTATCAGVAPPVSLSIESDCLGRTATCTFARSNTLDATPSLGGNSPSDFSLGPREGSTLGLCQSEPFDRKAKRLVLLERPYVWVALPAPEEIALPQPSWTLPGSLSRPVALVAASV
jgi:hypothetical protein